MIERSAGERDAWDVRDWWIVGVLAALTTIVFFDVLFLGHNFYIRDVYSFYYPTKKIVRDVILGGNVPYWNPHYAAGQPMAANPEYEVFYPLQWLVLLPSYWLGFRLHVVAHVYVAIAGAYALLRSLELRRATSVVGAISFALGGFVLANTGTFVYLFGVAWAPLIALFARRYFLGGRSRDLAAASLALGMQMLVGEPTNVVQSAFVLFVATAFIGRFAVSIRRAAGILAGSAVIAAVQIIPTADFIRDSVRSLGFSFGLVTSSSTPPAKLLELFHPAILGRYLDSMHWYWGGSLYDRGTPFYWSIYCGVTVAIFALAGLFTPTRGRRMFAIVFATSIVLALGAHTPLYRFLYAAGLGRNLRYPEKYLLMGICATILFAALTIDRFFDGDRRVFRITVAISTGLLLLSLSVALFSTTDSYSALFREAFHLRPGPTTDYKSALSEIEWWKEVVRLGLFVGVIALCRRVPSKWSTALLLLFVTLDVVSVAREASPTIGRQFYEPPAIAGTKKSGRLFNEAGWQYYSGAAYPLPLSGEGYYWTVRNGVMMNNAALWNFDPVLDRDYDLTYLVPTMRFTRAFLRARQNIAGWPQPFATMADAGMRGVLANPVEEARRIRGQWAFVQPVRIESMPVRCRYYFAEAVTPFRGDADFLARIAAGVPETTAFVAEPVQIESGGGRVLSVVERPNEAFVKIASNARSLLVRSVTHHRYWRAWIDGSPASIVPVNIAFQGIVVPAGKHTIVFRYRNPLVIPSAALSLIATIAALLAMFFDRSRQKAATP